MLAALLPAEVYAVFLVFVRMGAAIMLMPGIGDPYVSVRARLLLALAIAFLVTPILAPALPPLPEAALPLVLLILGEIVIGLFLGSVARLMMAALTTAGMVIAYMSSLANALVDDPSAAQQGSIAGSFLSLVALLAIFALDLHHLLLYAVVDSYQLFVPGQPLPAGDLSDAIAQLASKSFLLSFQIAAPFVAVGGIFYLGIGLLSRLMPQVQVFFVAMPLQVSIGLIVLFFTLPVAIRWFVITFEEAVSSFVGPF